MDVPAVASVPVSNPFFVAPFSADRVIRQTFALWRANLVAFAAVLLVTHAAIAALSLLPHPRPGGFASLPWGFALALANLAFLAFAAGALTHGAFQALTGRRVTTVELLSAGARGFRRVFAASLNATIRMILWFLLLFLPGISAACRYYVAVPAAVATPGASSSEAVKRSVSLTAGHQWSILVLVVCSFGIPAIVGLFTAGMAGAGGATSPVVTAVNWLVSAIVSCLGDTASAVAFHHLRTEKEGSPAAQLETVFE